MSFRLAVDVEKTIPPEQLLLKFILVLYLFFSLFVAVGRPDLLPTQPLHQFQDVFGGNLVEGGFLCHRLVWLFIQLAAEAFPL